MQKMQGRNTRWKPILYALRSCTKYKAESKRPRKWSGLRISASQQKWIAVRTIGYEPAADGTMRRITRSKSGFRTKKEAVEYLPLVGREDKTRPTTFIELYDAWEPTHRAGKSTMDCYRAAKKYFRPIWHQKLADITVDDLQECLDSCGKGKRTQENMKALAGLIYKYAIPRNMAKSIWASI